MDDNDFFSFPSIRLEFTLVSSPPNTWWTIILHIQCMKACKVHHTIVLKKFSGRYCRMVKRTETSCIWIGKACVVTILYIILDWWCLGYFSSNVDMILWCLGPHRQWRLQRNRWYNGVQGTEGRVQHARKRLLEIADFW